MDISFRTTKLRKECNEAKLAQRRWGSDRARMLRQRLDELAAMEKLSIMRQFPQARCHELKGNRNGQLAVDLDKSFRLIFCPANDPVSKKVDGGLDWEKVTAIMVIELEDYHG